MSLAESISRPCVDHDEAGQELTKKILLLGNDDRVTLAVARGLGRAGISVHVAWIDAESPALKSRYVSRFHRIPPYRLDCLDWLDALNSLVREQSFDLVIPCNDFAVIPLQVERERLDPDANWYLINHEAFEVAFDKAKTSRLAKALGINVPCEHLIGHEEIRELSHAKAVSEVQGRELKFPIYLKPRSSITQTDVENKRSAQKVETPAELAQSFRENCPADGLLIQESFSGVGIGVEVLAGDGEVLMQIQHQRLRETIDGGSTYRETIAEIPELSDAVHQMVKRLNYTGVAMFEFRYCAETGDWVFLEINARFWGSLPLAIAAGANFPFALYQMLVHGRREFDNAYQIGRRCRNLISDLRAYRKQQDSKLCLRNLLLGRDHLDFFAKDDWRPQAASLGALAASMLGKFFKR